jgi:NADH dehydrogenase
LKDIADADTLRNHMLAAFEEAAQTDEPERRAALLTFVIVGGGPTGVELAVQLALLARRTLRKEYPALVLNRTRVVLVNAGEGVLATFPHSLREDARRRLGKMGVELRLEQVVESIEHGVVRLADGSRIAATTVVWAAGVRASELAAVLDVPVGQAGRIRVTPALNLRSRPEVFVVGDMASPEGAKYGRPYPMVAQVAMQQGRLASKNITALERRHAPRTFRYSDKGQLAIIGRRSALVDAFGLRLRGQLAWFVWLGLHLLKLRGVRNRLVVLFDWIAVYTRRTRGAGIITRAQRTPDQAHATRLDDPSMSTSPTCPALS